MIGHLGRGKKAEVVVVKAIQMIEDHAHKSGLTQTMKTWLEQQVGGAR